MRQKEVDQQQEPETFQDSLLIKFRRSIPTSLTVAEVLQHLRQKKQEAGS